MSKKWKNFNLCPERELQQNLIKIPKHLKEESLKQEERNDQIHSYENEFRFIKSKDCFQFKNRQSLNRRLDANIFSFQSQFLLTYITSTRRACYRVSLKNMKIK